MLDSPFTEHLHAVHESVPAGYRDAQLPFDGLCIEGGAMRHLHRALAVINSDGQGVVADDPHGGELRGGCQGAIAGGSQQHIGVGNVIGLDGGGMAGASQRPDLLAAFQDAGGFKLKARDFREVTVELQDFTRLHDLIALADYGQWGLRVRSVQDLALWKGKQTALCVIHHIRELHRSLFDLPIHSGLLLPDFKGLVRRELVAQAMPGRLADVGHLFDEVSHEGSPAGSVTEFERNGRNEGTGGCPAPFRPRLDPGQRQWRNPLPRRPTRPAQRR